MILVLLGTQHNSFARLLEEIEKCINDGTIKEEVIVQAGFTKYNSHKMRIFDLLQNDELDDLVNDSNLIITHGGVGSIMLGLKKNKKVIAIPRLSKYNEHVNDHQVEIVTTFNEKGFIMGRKDVSELKNAIEKIKDFNPNEYRNDNTKMINIIGNYIDNIK